ncbi:MAG: hypothetical protein V1820_06005 [archaeon]
MAELRVLETTDLETFQSYLETWRPPEAVLVSNGPDAPKTAEFIQQIGEGTHFLFAYTAAPEENLLEALSGRGVLCVEGNFLVYGADERENVSGTALKTHSRFFGDSLAIYQVFGPVCSAELPATDCDEVVAGNLKWLDALKVRGIKTAETFGCGGCCSRAVALADDVVSLITQLPPEYSGNPSGWAREVLGGVQIRPGKYAAKQVPQYCEGVPVGALLLR